VRSVNYHPDARAEFLHEIAYFAGLSVGLSERFDRAVIAAEALAAATPDRWPQYAHGTRRVMDKRFKFSLVYVHDEQSITVIAIAPFRRPPGYWSSRLNVG